MINRNPAAGHYVARPCDFCGGPSAPLGFAPPPRLGIPIRRPLKSCGAVECNSQARARVQALIERHDPLTQGRASKSAPAKPALAEVDPAQKCLF